MTKKIEILVGEETMVRAGKEEFSLGNPDYAGIWGGGQLVIQYREINDETNQAVERLALLMDSSSRLDTGSEMFGMRPMYVIHLEYKPNVVILQR